MTFDLVESVKEVFSGEMTNKMAGLLGESAVGVQEALQGVIPSVLTGVLLKADSGNIQDTLNLVTEAARIEIPFNLDSLVWWWDKNSKGMVYKDNLFGDKASGLSDAIATFSGISNKSASCLLSIAAPAALAVLGKHVLDANMNANGLRSFLNSQKKKVFNALPAGILMEGILGFENLSVITEKFYGGNVSGGQAKTSSKWILPILLILIASAVIWFLMNRPQPASKPKSIDSAEVITSTDTTLKVPVPESSFSVKLPDGTKLKAKKGGIEDQIISFLNDPNSKPSRRFLFNFDQVSFKNGTAVITPESLLQLQNVANILNAYPKARIKIGGFTSQGGDNLQNLSLSEKRGVSISAAIGAAGANRNQILGVEGFGSEFSKYPADAADSLKGKDSRVAISIQVK